MEDLGSGSLIDFSPYGFPKEPTVQEIVKAGIDVVTFSGDKLLGGPQAGIIVGRKEMVSAIKKNPLNRALRIDKFTLAALESVLREYLDMDQALTRVPTLAMLTTPPDELKKRARRLLARLRRDLKGKCEVTMMATVSRVGGGALPEFNIESWAIVLEPIDMSINTMEHGLRALSLPIIGRIEKDRFLLDVRTLQEREFFELVRLLSDFFAGGKQ
jgi:L-seryl-tRNA(Ser) seleniumtransferase